jgi:hypothetical protein
MEPVKQHDKNTIDRENKSIEYFKYIRPNLVKLFTHLILLYLSIKGYLSFQSTEESYSDFLAELEKPVIVDVKMISSTSSCPWNYTDIDTTFFPDINNGCRCDMNYFVDEMCPFIEGIARRTGNENTWKTTCSQQDSRGATGRLLQSANPLNTANITKPTTPTAPTIDHFKNIPNKCDCYANITGIANNKTIDIWFPNKKLCILKDKNLTTLKYLSSAMNAEDCPQANLCQTYFCKNKFTSDVSKPCPVVDVYFDHKFVKIEGNKTIQYIDNREWSLHADTFYSQMFTTNKTFENTIIPPMISISISRSGKCVSGSNSIYSDHPLLNKVDCPIDQRYYSLSKLSLQEVLTNNNYLDDVLRIPGMNRSLNNENKWSLDSQYGFHKFTLTCLMNNYDKINLKTVSALNQTLLGDFAYKQRKIGYILQGFLQFTSNYKYQNYLQIIILALNATLVFVSIVTVFYKIFSYCLDCHNCCHSFFSLEIYFTFFIELSLGALGGASYFTMSTYIDFLDSLLTSGCVDNYVQYKFGVFQQTLSDTSDQNLEVFFIVLLKILLIIISTIYYSCALEKMTCRKFGAIIKENIGEGEEEGGDDEQEEKSKLKVNQDDNQKPRPDEKNNQKDEDLTNNDHHKVHPSNQKSLFDKNDKNKDEIKDSVLPVNQNRQSIELPNRQTYDANVATTKKDGKY